MLCSWHDVAVSTNEYDPIHELLVRERCNVEPDAHVDALLRDIENEIFKGETVKIAFSCEKFSGTLLFQDIFTLGIKKLTHSHGYAICYAQFIMELPVPLTGCSF